MYKKEYSAHQVTENCSFTFLCGSESQCSDFITLHGTYFVDSLFLPQVLALLFSLPKRTQLRSYMSCRKLLQIILWCLSMKFPMKPPVKMRASSSAAAFNQHYHPWTHLFTLICDGNAALLGTLYIPSTAL